MSGTVAQFVDALAFLNANTESLTSTLTGLMKTFEERPKLAKPARQQKAETEKTQEELEDEYWQSTQASGAIAKVVGGEVSSVSLLHDMQELEKKINDVAKAQELGIISTREAVATVAELGKDYAELALVAGGKSLGGQAGAQLVQAATSAPSAGAGFFMKQIMGVATGALGLLGGTALGGGLFGLMLHGVMYADRLAAEAGEITNIFSAAGATASRSAIGHFAAFQEKAQTFYGVSRQEVQGVLKEFLLAGVTVDEIMEGGRKKMGEVGHDVVTLSLAMDKMFELSGGFTAQKAMEVVRNQGASVGDAVDRIMRVEMLAHRASVSVGDFTQEAVSAANELADYGVRVDSVAIAMTSLQDRFKDIGLNAQAAMEYAQQGVKDIAGGLKGANLGIQTMLAEQLGLGSDMRARYRLLDALSAGKERDFIDVVHGLHRIAKTQTRRTYGGTEEVREREYLERQGFGLMGSKAVYTIGEQVERGQKVDAISKDEWEDIRKAFKIEGTKISELQKQSAQLTKALAKMGQGILFTITNFMALMIISVKTILSVDWKLEVVEGMVKSTLGGTVAKFVRGAGEAIGMVDDGAADAGAVLAMFNEQWRATARGAKQAYSGMSDSLSALNDIVQPLMKPIYMAIGIEAGESDYVAGIAGLTPEFWREFDAMCKRLGVDPKELKKVIMAETGWNAWGADRVNYVIGSDGRPKLDAQGRKIAQAKGLGAWIHSTAIGVAKMTEEQWQNLENMPAMEQLPFLERSFRALRIRGLTAEQIHVKLFGTGYMKTNPMGAMYIGKQWWEGPEGQAWLRAHPEYRIKAMEQYNLYWQNKDLDWDKKGYITAEDVARTTLRCEKCGKVLAHCKCPKVGVKDAVRTNSPSGPGVRLTIEIHTPAAVPPVRSTVMRTAPTSAELFLSDNQRMLLEAYGIYEPPSTGTAPPPDAGNAACDPNVASCADPDNPDKPAPPGATP